MIYLKNTHQLTISDFTIVLVDNHRGHHASIIYLSTAHQIILNFTTIDYYTISKFNTNSSSGLSQMFTNRKSTIEASLGNIGYFRTIGYLVYLKVAVIFYAICFDI